MVGLLLKRIKKRAQYYGDIARALFITVNDDLFESDFYGICDLTIDRQDQVNFALACQ